MNFFSAVHHSLLFLLIFYLTLLPLLNAELDDQLVNYILKQYPNIEVMMQIPSHCRGLAKENLLKCSFDGDCGRQHCHDHGYCVSYRFRDIEPNIPHALCLCDPGWTGSSCKEDEDECKLFNPCRKRSICQNTVGSYLCICDNGDPECNQQSISGCNEYSCLNGGICKNFACDCISGWSGPRCEIREQQEIKQPISQVYLYPNKKLFLGRFPMTDNSEFNPVAIPYPINPVGYQYPVIPTANQNPSNPVLPYPQGWPFNVPPQNPAVVRYPTSEAVLPAVDTSKISHFGEKLITAKKTVAKSYIHKIIILIISIFVLAGIGTAAVIYFFKNMPISKSKVAQKVLEHL